MFGEIHGKHCVQLGGRWFAVQKELGRADRVAQQSHDRLRGSSWSRILPAAKTARVIVNHK